MTTTETATTNTATRISDMAQRRKNLKQTADAAYAAMKELDFEIIADLREQYPEDWHRWERGISSFNAEGITVPVSRTYDPALLIAEFGETDPELLKEIVTEEVKVVHKINGRKLTELWKQADMAKRLQRTIVPPKPSLKVK